MSLLVHSSEAVGRTCLNAFGIIICLPVMLILYLIFIVYHILIEIILKIEYRDKFVSLWKGPENLWMNDGPPARAVANSLFKLSTKNYSSTTQVIEKLRSGLRERFNKPELQKLFYKRSSKYGYHFWERRDQVNINDYVNEIDVDLHGNCKIDCKLVNNKILDKYLCDVSNEALPLNDTANWEILVGRPCSMANESEVQHFFVMLRIHHSLSDGMGILCLLINYISNPSNDEQQLFQKVKDCTVANEKSSLKSTGKLITRIMGLPSYFFSVVSRLRTKSSIYGPKLNGIKLLAYYEENSPASGLISDTLLYKLRKIKSIAKCKVEDVLLAAVSASLYKYFMKIGERPPEFISISMPLLMKPPNPKNVLDNTVSGAELILRFSPKESLSTLERLEDVIDANKRMRRSCMDVISYWIIHSAFKYLTKPILRGVILEASTTTLSNIMGPPSLYLLEYPVDKVSVWGPHRLGMGLTFAIFSFKGLLNLTLYVDSALIKDKQLLDEILQNILQEICQLYDQFTLADAS